MLELAVRKINARIAKANYPALPDDGAGSSVTYSSLMFSKYIIVKFFNVLLTVHHAMILGNCPT